MIIKVILFLMVLVAIAIICSILIVRKFVTINTPKAVEPLKTPDYNTVVNPVKRKKTDTYSKRDSSDISGLSTNEMGMFISDNFPNIDSPKDEGFSGFSGGFFGGGGGGGSWSDSGGDSGGDGGD